MHMIPSVPRKIKILGKMNIQFSLSLSLSLSDRPTDLVVEIVGEVIVHVPFRRHPSLTLWVILKLYLEWHLAH